MANATETLQATLSETEYGALKVLGESLVGTIRPEDRCGVGRLADHGQQGTVQAVRSRIRRFQEVWESHSVAARGLESFDR